MKSTQTRIAVIGGGVAGLTTAYAISRSLPHIDLHLYEASPRLGGIIRTETIDDFLVEFGPDMVATDPDAAMRLVQQLEIQDEMIPPASTVKGAAVVHNGKLHRVPEGFVLMRPTRILPMLTTPLLSWSAKARLAREPFVATRGDVADESIESFVVRRLGRELLQRIVQPLVGGIYVGDVAKLSMAATMPQFWKMEAQHGSLLRATLARRSDGTDQVESQSAGARYEKFRSFKRGMQTLVDTLAKRIGTQALHLSTTVQAVTPSLAVTPPIAVKPQTDIPSPAGRWQVQLANGCTEAFDQVILATPARIAGKLVQAFDHELAAALSEIRYASSAVVVLAIPASSIQGDLSVAGFVVPITEGRSILATSFTGDKFAGRVPAGMRLLRVFIGGELQADLLQRDDGELVKLAKDELKALIAYDGRSLFTEVVRWTDAMPQYEVGHLQRIQRIERLRMQHRGLTLIGNSYTGVGIAPTIGRAMKAADEIVSGLHSAAYG